MYTYTTVKKFKKKWWALCVRLNHSISRTLISKHSGLIGQIHMQKKKGQIGLDQRKSLKNIFNTQNIRTDFPVCAGLSLWALLGYADKIEQF